MKASSFTSKLKDIATNYKTVYAWGVFGGPITRALVNGKAKQYPSWYTSYRINNVFAPLYDRKPKAFGFDCVGLVKGVLWGWDGNSSQSYGGAVYASNGVPDLSADAMIGKCSGVSKDFSSIAVGEFLWMKGHCGVYIGNGLAVESTPDNSLQLLQERVQLKVLDEARKTSLYIIYRTRNKQSGSQGGIKQSDC